MIDFTNLQDTYEAPSIQVDGPHIPSYEDILKHLIIKFQEIYGSDIYLENDSQDYQFLSSLALLTYDTFQTFLLAYNNQYPDTAIGTALDRLCALNGITRNENSYSYATVRLTGVLGTEILYGQVRDVNGYVWQLFQSVVIDTPVEGSSTLGYKDVVATCITPGSIQASANTITTIVNPQKGWQSVTNPSAAVVGFEVETDSKLRERRARSVDLASTTPFDAILAAISSLTDDSGSTLVNRIVGYENDTGNDIVLPNTTTGGETKNVTLPPHSIAVVCECGDIDETLQKIAETIYLKKTPGTSTVKCDDSTTGLYGVQRTVESSSGLQNTIRFSRLEVVPMEVEINLTYVAGYGEDIENQIKQNVVNYLNSLEVGEDLQVSNLYLPILKANPNVSAPVFWVTGISVNDSTTSITIGKFKAAFCDSDDVSITATPQS